ncbi:hypothetical protein [Halocatena marina]|uniref:Uncharacterized protein n=1 Tax=Halocatena marina TaxID=2934937 RepID=A0ABD5YMY5_9EURY|nr:hypothetical protein [Halocatena marina]
MRSLKYGSFEEDRRRYRLQNHLYSSIYNVTNSRFGGQGNVATIVDALEAEIPDAHPVRTPWYFPSLGEYASLLESNGFEVTYARLFDRPTTLSGYTGLER